MISHQESQSLKINLEMSYGMYRTEYISTRWYRAPECLLTDGYYGPEMDIWGAGCVLFELIEMYPLFQALMKLIKLIASIKYWGHHHVTF